MPSWTNDMKIYLKELWQNKWLRWSCRILGIGAALLVVVGIAATYYVHSHQKELIAKVKNVLEEKTGGDVSIGDVSIGFWKTFPLLHVGVSDVAITDSVYHRPLIKMGDIYSSVNLIKLLFGKISVRKLHVANGNFTLFTDSSGYSNAYLLQSKDTTRQRKKHKGLSPPDINIGEFVFRNIQISVVDKHAHKDIEITVNEVRAKLRNNGGVYAIAMHQDCLVGGLGFKLANGSFLKGKRLIADWRNMAFNPRTSDLTFDETPVTLGTQVYNIGGGFNFSSDSATSKLDLKVNAQNTTYADASSLLSQNVQSKLRMAQWLGPIDVVATLKGSLKQSTPRIQVQAKSVNCQMVLPGDLHLDSCTFVGAYLNQIDEKKQPDDTNSEILLHNFKASWNGVPLHGKAIQVHDLIQPSLQLHLESDCDVASLDDKFALNTISLLGGQAHLELEYNGKLLSTNAVIENIAGKIRLQNGKARYNPRGFLFNNIGGNILFNGNDIIVQNLRCDMNQNFFLINVAGNNIGKAAISGSGSANVVCTVLASRINLGDFMAMFAQSEVSSKEVKRPTRPVQLSGNTLNLDNIFQKGTLHLNFSSKELVYRHLYATDLKGNLVFRPTQWEMNKVSFRHAGGVFNLTSIVNPHTQVNDATISVDMQQVDIQKVMYAFDNFGMTGLSFKNLRGNMNLQGNIKTKIDNNGALVPRSTSGYIDLNLRNGALVNFEPLLGIQKYVFKNRNLNNVQFAPITNRFDIRNGSIFVHRMEIASSAMRMFVEGIYSPYGNTDMAIQVPFSSLLSQQSKVQAMHKEGKDSKQGASMWLHATSKNGGPVSIGLDLFKAFRKDKIGERFKTEFGEDEKP